MVVKSFFLNGDIHEEVYVKQSQGYEKKIEEHKVYKLLKALYGQRQAPRAWYARSKKFLEKLGFVKCPYKHVVYMKREGNKSLIIAVLVDDLLVTGSNVANIIEFKNQMCDEFSMSDLRKLVYYLGIEVELRKGCMELKQIAYAKKLLEKAGMQGCNETRYPMHPKITLHKDKTVKGVDPTMFRSLIGGLRYLVRTRPDICCRIDKSLHGETYCSTLECSKECAMLCQRNTRVWSEVCKRFWKSYANWVFGQ